MEHLESDLGAAAFLIAEGYRLTGVVPAGNRRLAFRFENVDGECRRAVLRYYQGASVSAKDLIAAEKNLKTLLYSQNGDGNGKFTSGLRGEND
jgi:hypothetical protein